MWADPKLLSKFILAEVVIFYEADDFQGDQSACEKFFLMLNL